MTSVFEFSIIFFSISAFFAVYSTITFAKDLSEFRNFLIVLTLIFFILSLGFYIVGVEKMKNNE